MKARSVSAFCALTIAFSVVLPAPAQDRDALEWIHPDARMIAGVNWKAARASPVGELVARKLRESGATQTKQSGNGLDFLESVDRIVLSAPEGFTPGAPSPAKANPPVLIYMQGVIQRDKLKRSFGAATAVERFRGIDLYLPPPGAADGMVAAVVSDSVMVMGDRPTVEKALAAPQRLRNGALLERVRRMEAECDIWMVADGLPAKPVASGGAPPMAAAMDDMKAMDLGISLKDGAGLRMNMVFADPDKAQGMAAMIQLAAAMSASNPKTASPALIALSKSLNVKAEGASIRLSLDIPLAAVEEGLEKAGKSFAAMGRSMSESITEGGKPAPVAGDANSISVSGGASGGAPQRNTIRVYGMEGGVKEIPIQDGGSTPKKPE